MIDETPIMADVDRKAITHVMATARVEAPDEVTELMILLSQAVLAQTDGVECRPALRHRREAMN
ncbi:MAG TPA: hypothetical protein VLG66_16235 [Alphaproteobacteria bacterium]|nr:hypothetical protein [Alphaproteobacteria bacterium]